MGFLYDTEAEYDAEIELTRVELRNAVKAKKFRLSTSQSDQTVEMDMTGITKYLSLLTTERQAFIQRSCGAGVTSITYRRNP